MEVHVDDAMFRPHDEQITEARILMYAPKVLQITTRLGSLDFSYHGDFRVLPEGQTYRIYLDSDAAPEAQGPAGAGSGCTTRPSKPGTMSKGTKVAFFILAGAGTGLAAWGIVDVIQSNSSIESPAKPWHKHRLCSGRLPRRAPLECGSPQRSNEVKKQRSDPFSLFDGPPLAVVMLSASDK
jgi:hypothetical protein